MQRTETTPYSPTYSKVEASASSGDPTSPSIVSGSVMTAAKLQTRPRRPAGPTRSPRSPEAHVAASGSGTASTAVEPPAIGHLSCLVFGRRVRDGVEAEFRCGSHCLSPRD